jgi:crossover junction endodeoxyribonuclease RuvC
LRILGVDPGTLILGYGVVDLDGSRLAAVEFGAIRARRGESIERRLGFIQSELETVIRRSRPDVLAIERVFAGKSIPSAIRIGEARGAVLAIAARAGVPVVEYTPAEVKKAVTGSGRAAKEQIQEMVKIIFGLKEVPRPADAADALAIAVCHSNRC